MDWNSPIQVITTQMNIDIENQVMNAVHSVGVNINKEELINCIEKQKPQKPKLEWNGDKTYSWEICPRCEKAIEKKYKYCPNCGQAIKWENI